MDIAVKEFVSNVLKEDIGRGDLFAKCVKPCHAVAHVRAKQAGILAGVAYAKAVGNLSGAEITFHFSDGEPLKAGDLICEVSGDNTTLLSIERTLLNMLQHASGIATSANRYVSLLGNSGVKLLDTRKTRPLLREFEKYAARCGGVVNHRLGLDDTLMLKDTHLKTIDDLERFMLHARQSIPFTAKIEIECETIEMAEAAFKAGADIIMCDNMDIEEIIRVVSLRDHLAPSTLIEVSGNITEKTIENYLQIGIDAISSGSIIHQATWLDFSMKMQ